MGSPAVSARRGRPAPIRLHPATRSGSHDPGSPNPNAVHSATNPTPTPSGPQQDRVTASSPTPQARRRSIASPDRSLLATKPKHWSKPKPLTVRHGLATRDQDHRRRRRITRPATRRPRTRHGRQLHIQQDQARTKPRRLQQTWRRRQPPHRQPRTPPTRATPVRTRRSGDGRPREGPTAAPPPMIPCRPPPHIRATSRSHNASPGWIRSGKPPSAHKSRRTSAPDRC